MFANGRDRDVFDEYHFVMRIAGQRFDVLLRIDPHAFGKLGVKVGDAFWRLNKSLACRIFADPFEYHPNAFGDLFSIKASSFLSWHILAKQSSPRFLFS